MNNRFFKAVKILVLIGVFLSLSGCTYTLQLTKDLQIPASETEKIPMKVGLYMSPEFCQYTFTEKSAGGYKYVLHLGEALCSGTGKMLERVFTEVIRLESVETGISQQRIEAIVIPEIVSVDVVTTAWTFQNFEVLITLKYTFMDPDERILWVDTFQGEGRKRLGTVFTEGKNASKCMQMAVEDQLRKALKGISSSKWWESVE